MPREKQYESPAERQAAYRARKREQVVDPDLPERDLAQEEPESPAQEMMRFEGKLLPVTRGCDWTLEQYLERELAITRDQLKRGVLRDTEVRGASTLQRSRRYLRWRYAGFRTGQVSGL